MYKISISAEEIERLELRSFPGKIVVVDDDGPVFKEAVRYLKQQKVLGFDTETRPSFDARRGQYGTALLQLSGPGKAYLFRLNKLGMPPALCKILADPGIVKVGAATGGDIHGLQDLHGFKAQSFVDLQQIAWQYGIRDMAVKKLTAIILGFKISKAQQLSNWEAETLSAPQQLYAATDAWVCREMYMKLSRSEKRPLTAEERIPPQALENQRRQAEERAAAIERGEIPAEKEKKKTPPRRKRRSGNAPKTEAEKPKTQHLTRSQRRRRQRQRARARQAAEAAQNENSNG